MKNENVLPLQKEQKIALIGPFAHNGDILGPWSWQGSQEEAVKVDEGFMMKMDQANLFVAKGCDIETGTEEQLQEALKAAEQAEVIVLALGEHSRMSGEAKCRADIRLPEVQLQLIAELKKLGKPIAVVLFNGRPIDLHGVIDKTDAVLEAWYPGTEGGAAIADLLFGDVNPSGKITMSFPYSVGQVPVYYNAFNTGRPKDEPVTEYVSKYLDIPNSPLLPFGFGLSYTTFEYGELTLSNNNLTDDTSISVSIKVTNTGDRAGDEIVQLYIRDLVGEVVRPLKELKGYENITLNPGETKEVTFTITEEMLRYHHADLQFTSDAGKFIAFVGTNSVETKEKEFVLVK